VIRSSLGLTTGEAEDGRNVDEDKVVVGATGDQFCSSAHQPISKRPGI